MADMGLMGMGGAAGAGDALQNLFHERMAAAENDRRNKELEQQDALTRLKLQEHADEIRQRVEGQKQAEADKVAAAKAAEQDRQDKQAAATFTMNPVGSELPAPIASRAQQLGFPVSKIPGQEVQQTSGFMPLPSAPSQGPGMQPIGGLTPIQGPQVQAGSSTTTADPQSPLNAPDTFKRGATQADVVKEREDAMKADKPVPDPIATHAANRAFDVAHPLPHEAPTVVVQSVDDQGNPVTRIVPKTAGSEFARSNPQMDRQRKLAEFASGDVAAALDQIDAAEKAGLLGPAAGRTYGKFLAGLVGSTGDPAVDKRLGGLKAAIKDLNTSYPMAISGTARGGGGAIDRLHSVLDSDKLSADLMRGALHEISGALARRTATPKAGAQKLTAEELIKKYGGTP